MVRSSQILAVKSFIFPSLVARGHGITQAFLYNLHLSLAGGSGHGITQALLDKPSSFPSPGARGHGITQAFLGITASRLSLAGRAQPRRYR